VDPATGRGPDEGIVKDRDIGAELTLPQQFKVSKFFSPPEKDKIE
jgi:hypothetical protein